MVTGEGWRVGGIVREFEIDSYTLLNLKIDMYTLLYL